MAYASVDERREKAARWHREKRASDPEWVANVNRRNRITGQAHRRLKAAIRRGEIVPLHACEECEAVEGGPDRIVIEPAHWDYSQPLLVRWLCRSCHRRWDLTVPKISEEDHRRYEEGKAAYEATFWTQERIVESLCAFAAQNNGVAPSARQAGKFGLPHSNTVQKRFGSWNAGIRAAGLLDRPFGRRPKKLERWREEDCGYVTPCWIWLLFKDREGYGVERVDGRHCLAHRVAYEREHGALSRHVRLRRLCGKKDCVRPDHIEIRR